MKFHPVRVELFSVFEDALEASQMFQFTNFTKDAKDLYCHVHAGQGDLGGGVLIYIPGASVSDVFKNLVLAEAE